MSFIKVKDPRKREELVRDFIETRKRIKDNFISRKVGESEYQTGLTKLFKPVTETQKATAKEITDAQKATAEKCTSELLPIKEGIEELPTKLFRKIFPSIELKASDIMNLGPLAVNALLQAFTKKNIDLSFGLYAKNRNFYIGSEPVIIEDNDIKVDDIIFEGKMKARYDNHVIDRKFKPGDKVLALLPIPGRPLQARYFGPYTIDKKTSDLNYIIKTPGRRKNKQMCHVNMLKEYFDRDSSISKPITVVNTVPQESNVFEPEVNSDFIDKSDPGPSKLENSDILRNLNNKLSHLEPSQQEELKQLIHEYEHLFPDIPTRTDKIYHDVIVEDSKPIKQRPYRMNPLKRNTSKMK